MSDALVLKRARSLLARPDAWIDQERGGSSGAWPLRLSPDRRGRVSLWLDDATLTALIAEPGLRPRSSGGWTARAPTPGTPDHAGRPGMIEGERAVMDANGGLTLRRANLGESPLAWLARRRDAEGRPFLGPAHLAAGERLRRDVEAASKGASVTMRWDALPRAAGGSSARVEPGDAALAAGRRAAAALAACGADRAMVQAICILASPLRIAEQTLGLKRRSGRLALRRGLDALARHYGIG